MLMKKRLGAPIAWLGVVIYLVGYVFDSNLLFAAVVLVLGLLVSLFGSFIWVVQEKRRAWGWALLGLFGPFGLLAIWGLSPNRIDETA
jgi:hypothetical protein